MRRVCRIEVRGDSSNVRVKYAAFDSSNADVSFGRVRRDRDPLIGVWASWVSHLIAGKGRLWYSWCPRSQLLPLSQGHSSMDNPFEAPESDLRAVGVLSGSRRDLRRIAVYQKTVILCMAFQLLLVLLQLTLMRQPPDSAVIMIMILTTSWIILLVGAISVFLLAMKTYGVTFGILYGILALVPCFGLIILLIINSKATKTLKDNGIKVGFLGANLSQFDADDPSGTPSDTENAN